nr:MAG TPA: hypothetical protein [Caudoviricetes sp.]
MQKSHEKSLQSIIVSMIAAFLSPLHLPYDLCVRI